MKLVDFETLKELPTGTIFAEYEDFCLHSSLCIKVKDGEDFYNQSSLYGFMNLKPCFRETIPNLFEVGDKEPIIFKMYDGSGKRYSIDKKYLILEEDDFNRIIDVLEWAKNGCVEDNPGEIKKQYDTDDIVYFKLQPYPLDMDDYNKDWLGYYPDNERFKFWLGKDNYHGIKFCNEEWVKENQLCVRCQFHPWDYSYAQLILVTATRGWVKDNCPELLTDYREFLRHANYKGDIYLHDRIYNDAFLPYKEENIGIEWD